MFFAKSLPLEKPFARVNPVRTQGHAKMHGIMSATSRIIDTVHTGYKKQGHVDIKNFIM